jgi:hypothetical protein
MDQKKFTNPFIQGTELNEISNSAMYMTLGSSIHSTVIRGICAEGAQLQWFNTVTHLENWSCLEVQGVICFFVGITESVSS